MDAYLHIKQTWSPTHIHTICIGCFASALFCVHYFYKETFAFYNYLLPYIHFLLAKFGTGNLTYILENCRKEVQLMSEKAIKSQKTKKQKTETIHSSKRLITVEDLSPPLDLSSFN